MTAIGSRRDTRARHEQARHLRGCGYTWAAIADALGYRTRSGAQSAVERLYARTRENPEVARRALADGLNLTKSLLFESLADAKGRKDVSAITALSREIRSVSDQLGKIDGLLAPQKLDVNVSVQQSRSAILERVEAELLALAQLTMADTNIIEGEVIG